MSGVYTTYWESDLTGREHEVDVYYDYTPGCPEQGPTWDCGGVPAEEEGVEITCMVLSGMGMGGRDLSILLTEAQVGYITGRIFEHIESESEGDDDRGGEYGGEYGPI
jgi:hypothetical protein